MTEPIKADPVNITYLRHVDEVKPLSSQKNDTNIFSESDSVFSSKYFKKLGRHFKNFFKLKNLIQVLYITNDKKERKGKNTYFVAITDQELIYEEERDKKVLRLLYVFSHDEIKTNQGVVYNLQAKMKFKQKLIQVGKDIQERHADVFEM